MQKEIEPYNFFIRYCDDMAEGIESAECDVMDEELGLTVNKLTKQQLPYLIETEISPGEIERKKNNLGFTCERITKRALFVTKITVFENEFDKLNYLNKKKDENQKS